MAESQWPAGTYELVADQWDERVSPLDKPFASVRHVKGDEVELDAETADRLGRGGAIQKPGEAQRANAYAAKAAFEAAIMALPESVREELLGSSEDEEEQADAVAEAAERAAEAEARAAEAEARADAAEARVRELEAKDPSFGVTSQPPTPDGGAGTAEQVGEGNSAAPASPQPKVAKKAAAPPSNG